MVKCQICKQEFKHQGALNLHLKKHEITREKYDKKYCDNLVDVEDNKCPDCGGECWVKMDVNNDIRFKKFIEQGYTEYCSNCMELR